MHSNTEGSSPSLRAQLGIGWNRALPPPFSFQNGFFGGGQHLTCPQLEGVNMPTNYTFEFWMKWNGSAGGIIDIVETLSSNSLTNDYGFQWFTTVPGWEVYGGASLSVTPTNGAKYHVVVKGNSTSHKLYINGSQVINVTRSNAGFTGAIARFYFGVRNNNGSIGGASHGYDELKFYNRQISDSEIALNYNNGLGNNPAQTEGLLIWCDFQIAEDRNILYPSSPPAGWSAGVYGIRDKSNNNNHLMQNGMTNNSTLGGALTAF